MSRITVLDAANAARAAAAATATVAAAAAALDSGVDLPAAHREALRLRVAYPHDNLGQLAARAAVTKDTYTGRLRRALWHVQRQAGR